MSRREPQIVVEQNGEKIIDARLNRSMRGHIGFGNHSEDETVARFRNIRLEEL